MTAAAPEFTAAHHVLLNGLAAAGNIVMAADPRFDDIAAAMAEALPHAATTGPRTDELTRVAAVVIEALATRKTDGMRWVGAMLEANQMLATLFYWRTSSALEALRQTLAEGAEDVT